jgi:hypothetical protein
VELEVAVRHAIAWLRRSRAQPRRRAFSSAGRPVKSPWVLGVYRELRALGVRQDLEFVWTVDGSGVIEERPRRIEIHLALPGIIPARVAATADRLAAIDLASVARHEVGHALLFLRPAEARRPDLVALFGDVRKKYRVGTAVDEITRRLERHGGLANPRYRRVISLYAATHPHESFAEAVRVVLARQGDERALRAFVAEHGLRPIVLEQLFFAARWLRGYDRG